MKGKNLFAGILAGSVLLISGCNKTKEQKVLVGGFTTGSEIGMSIFSFNDQNGKMKLTGEYDAGASPSFFCFSAKYDLAYAVNEVDGFKGEKAGGVTTIKVSLNKPPEKAGELPVAFGGPCHISISASGKFLFVASYASGSIAVVKVNSKGIPESVTDTIKFNSTDSLPSHPHMIAQDPFARHIYLTDLGLDRVLVYDLDTVAGKIIRTPFQEVHVTKGSGPRHFSFNKSGTKMYLINELGSAMMTFDVANDGTLNLIQTIRTTAEGFNGHNQSAAITISEDGRFLYGSNRGENSVVVFRINNDGTLVCAGRSTCGGDWPRFFMLDPSGKYLLCGNQRSNDISVFRINETTGIPEGPVFKAPAKAPAFIGFIK